MKRNLFLLLALSVLGFCLTGCQYFLEESDSASVTETIDYGIYSEFENYPKGRQTSSGHLTLTNEVNDEVLVFTSSVSPSNYVGTIPAFSSINVALDSEKFYSIVTVTKSAYEKDSELAAQSTVLVYYSNTQSYKVSVSPENLTGSATWIFNNNTPYWASVENANDSGEIFAVISPYAKRVSVPVQTDTSYDYKVVYKKQLKYGKNVIALSNVTSMEENDTASFFNLKTFTTNLNGTNTSSNYDLAPAVYFTNNTKKTVRVYNGKVQLTDLGIVSDDYTLASGVSALFTNFSEGTTASSLNIESIAWNENQYCLSATEFKKGYVYLISVETSVNKKYDGTMQTNFFWNIKEVTAESFYTKE